MADIFISYKREDQEEHGRVKPIADALRAEGYDVFYDVQVPPGSKWEEVLQGKINMARAVLVLWSAASVESDWVKEEAEMAKAAGKLIPVMLDAVSPPFGFARIESANLADWEGDLTDIEWKNLVAAVKARIGSGERDAMPGVTSVSYPRKQVTVTKSGSPHGGGRSGSGGGRMGLIAGLLVLALAAGGLLAVQMMDNGEPVQTTESVTAAVDGLAEPQAEDDAQAEREATATRDAAAAEAAAAIRAKREAERAFEEARQSNTADAYDAFASRYPNHPSAQTARDRAAAIRRAEAAASQTETDYSGISSRTYRVAGITLSNITLSPEPPARIVEGENITAAFSYLVPSGRTARVWARPVHAGDGACRYGASGSPELSGRGQGSQRFSMTGDGCATHTITGIRFSVQVGDDRDSAEQVIVPVRYSFR